MDKIYEKFGIYDFMGIWGPGAIVVTYFLFTMQSFLADLFWDMGIRLTGISDELFLLLLYTAVAYVVGVILHELGKLIYDLNKKFDSESIAFFELKDTKKPRLNPFERIRYDYNKALCLVKRDCMCVRYFLLKNPCVKFERARAYLKYTSGINTKRMDTYHSIYALARSLSVACIIHFIFVLISCLAYCDCLEVTFKSVSPYLLIVDGLLAYLFYIRAYRYCLSWIQNTYIQYFLCIGEKRGLIDNAELNQTTKINI